MQKKSLWKDIFKSIRHSKGRFFSIMGLMMLGAFALVGLQVTGPDMRETGRHYTNDLNVADMAVIGSFGIDQNDQTLLNKTDGLQDIEYGYFKDVVITDTTDSFRLFSKTDDLSQYEIREGRLPKNANEIAISAVYADRYHIGDTISFSETADAAGNKVLKQPTYQIVGFVYSGEILSGNNLGQSTAGTGSLKGYGVLTPDAFDSEVYMVARLKFNDLAQVDPYSQEYTNKLQAHKDTLDQALKDQPQKRLQTVKQEYQKKIDDGQQQIDQAKQQLADTEQQLKDAKGQLDAGAQKIAEAQAQLAQKVASATDQIKQGDAQLTTATHQLADAKGQLANAKQQLDAGANTLAERWQQLEQGRNALQAAQQQLKGTNDQLQASAQALNQGREAIAKGYQDIAASQDKLNQAQTQIRQAEQQVTTAQDQWDKQKAAYDQSQATFTDKQASYQAQADQINQAQNALDEKTAALKQEKAKQEQGLADLKAKIAAIDTQLADTTLPDDQRHALEEQRQALTAQVTAANDALATFLTETYHPGLAAIQQQQQTLDPKKVALAQAKKDLDQAEQTLAASKQKLAQGKQQLDANRQALEQKKADLKQGQTALQQAKDTLAASEQTLKEKEAAYQQGLAIYNQGVNDYNANLKTYNDGLAAWQKGAQQLDQKSKEYRANAQALQAAEALLHHQVQTLAQAKDTLASQQAQGADQIAQSKQTLAAKQQEYEQKAQTFADKQKDAQQEFADKQAQLDEAKEQLNHLALPTYSLNSRREIPGGEGTQIYTNIARIVDALANVFPIFLYFVAALVAFTTMSRFVEEERINAGTLKALGYDDRDVFKKFAFYGLTAGLIGTIIGVALGHTLIPSIAYTAYKVGFTLPPIEWHFHWGITAIALIASLVSSVLPAWIATKRELAEKPAQLLLPKPPAAGSKILLERIPFIWNRLSFTHKVTARNLFRYKQRMLMTIFGVAGAVSLLFAGLSVQGSIGGINDLQFGELIHYDMIVAENNYVSPKQEQEIHDRLNGDSVKTYTPVHYESITKVAGANKDKQDIKLLVPKNPDAFKDYITLRERKSHAPITLPDEGVVISERLAQLLKIKVGDTVTFNDSENRERQMTVAGITEMYMGHFAFMSPAAYEQAFHTDYHTDAQMVKLKDSSTANVEKEASEFMKYTGVLSVLQNTVFTNIIDTIVNSMNIVLRVLIIIAGLLGIVILYNLTNINVSERMRELSTIKVLGFYDKEVTLYIYRETILLTLIGILVGFGIGTLLHQYIIQVVPPEEVMFDPNVTAVSFIFPAIVIIVITTVLAFVIHERLKRVDMLEALSSIE